MYHIKYTTLNIRKGMENYQMMRKTAANQQGCPSDVSIGFHLFHPVLWGSMYSRTFSSITFPVRCSLTDPV